MLLNGKKFRSDSRIYLTGFMGVGKSTLGAALAESLKWKFFDSDLMIERQQGLTASELFHLKGENYFRDLESQMVVEVAQETEAVIALGGGAILRPENLKIIDSSGVRVYLQASVPTLVERLKGDRSLRPLLKISETDWVKNVTHLLESRRSIYETASLVFNTDGRTVMQLVPMLVEQLGSR